MTNLFRRTATTISADEGAAVAAVVHDAVEARRAVDALERERRAARDAERRLSAVLRDAPQPFLALDCTGRLSELNRRAEAMLGCTRAEALGTSVAGFLAPAAHAALERVLARYVASADGALFAEPLRLEVRSRRGTSTVVDATIGAVDDASGVLFHVFLEPVAARSASERSALTILAEVAAIIAEANDERSVHAVRNAAVYLAQASDAALCDTDVEALLDGPGATLSWPVPGGGTLAVSWDDPAADPPVSVREALAALAGIAAPALAPAAVLARAR